MVRNTPKHEFGVQCRGLRAFIVKIPTRLGCMNLCINFISSAHFAPKFGVQWGGSGAFVAKNSDATWFHEHVH
jgi:hypothetical protein